MNVIESSTVTEPGLYRMPADAYHVGPCNGPELSSSIAKIILRETPLHAWSRHSKFGRAPVESEEGDEEAGQSQSKAVQDFGSAAHKLALGYGRDVAWIDPAAHVGKKGGIPKGWTNDSIREARSEAQSGGRIPVLLRYQPGVEACAKALQERAEAWLGLSVAECLREVVMCWQEGGMWCKGMVDIMRPDMLRKADLKTTMRSVSPESVARHLYAEDMEVQAAFYERGSANLDPSTAGRSQFAFIFAEQRPPFIASPPIYPSEAGMQLGRWAVETAMNKWAECLQNDEWPAWSGEAYEAQPPAWKLSAMGNDL